MSNISLLQPNDRLRQERTRRCWRQQDPADELGTTVCTVKRWERGSQYPSAYFRIKLCALFGKSAEELGLIDMNELPVPPVEAEASSRDQTSISSNNVPVLWNIPYVRNTHFTGRDELLDRLDQHFSAQMPDVPRFTRQVAMTQPQAIKGLGGIGKTQIAVEYAYRARESGRYMYVLWVNASNEEALLTGFVTLAQLLPSFAGSNEANQQKLVAATKRWLEQCQERWLLIFDNADNLPALQEYLPLSGNGNILFTTRSHAVGSFAVPLDVDTMDLTEGTQFLLRRAQRLHATDEEVNEARNIVIALDGFPLALDQAGAFIEETGCQFSEYLMLYQQHRHMLLARRGMQTTNYPDSVATTWSLSFQKIERSNPAAAELLRLCAFLAPDHIPEELLKDGVLYWTLLLQSTVTDLLAFNQMIEDLLSFSLVKRLAENHLLSIHRLVQAVQVDMMGAEEQRQLVERIVLALNALFPRDPKTDISSWPSCLRYLEQVQACALLIQMYDVVLPEAADLLDRTGTYLSEHASYALAETLYQQALAIREHRGELHRPESAITLLSLGILNGRQGKYEQAEMFYRRALEIREQQLGTHHPEIARVLNNLGILYAEQEQYEQALSLYQRALSIYEQQLGSHHLQTARVLDNLGILYAEQGQYEMAELLYQRALAICEQQLGSYHPETALVLNNLGGLYRQQKRYELVESLYQQALSIYEQQLGLHHPDTAVSLHNLGELYRLQKKYEQAELFLHRALAVYEQQLERHPLTAECLSNLGLLSTAQERYEQAESFFARALAIQEQILTTNHPHLAETLYGLDCLYERQGDLRKAADLYQRALHIRKQVYGLEHPHTIEMHESLSTVREQISNTEKEK